MSIRQRHPADGRCQRGFTLVELMVTLAVLAVILSLAVPSFAEMRRRNGVTAAANELVAAYQIARMEAVRRNMRVVMCPTANGDACGGTDWARLLVFTDRDGDGAIDAGDDTVVRIVEVVRPGSGVVVTASTNVAAAGQRIRFGADGLVRVGANRRGALSVCHADLTSNNTRDVEIVVSRVGVLTRNAANCGAYTDPA